MRAPTPCLEPGCHDHVVNKGYCQAHQRPAFANNFRKMRLPKDWRTRRLIVLKRDNYTCYLCGGEGADTVDHIIPNDDNSLDNLAAVHDRVPPHCHRAKTAADNAEIIRGQRIKRRQ